jgi:hypothetical protein
MSTSGTYSFGLPKSRELIDEAYERIGMVPSLITQQQIEAAQRSLNFIMQEWVNKGNNLWTIRQGIIGLSPNQIAYNLPLGAIDVKTVTLRISNRNLGGTAFSSAGGIAQNAFDNNTATSCIQTSPNGYISYSYGVAQNTISMVGVQSTITTQYSLVAEYSFDNITWITALTIPKQTYNQNVIEWFAIPVAVPANLFRVRETGGATLEVEELYFNSAINDTILTRLSEFEYTAIPNKTQAGHPTTFWVDRQINPVIYLWLVPNGVFNAIFFTYWIALQDIGTMLDNAEVPARFLEALTSALAYRLAIKQKSPLEEITLLQALAEKSYQEAGSEDRERVPLRIYGDYMQGWTR